jgi:hypothetical protein
LSAVLHHAVLLQDHVQDLERPAALDHEVLGDDLEPVDDRLPREDVRVVGDPQAYADAIIAVSIEAVGRHCEKNAAGAGPAASQKGTIRRK